MLKLNGAQRYATQVTCKNGKYVPQPLEDEAAMPAHREAMGMEPFEEYAKLFTAPCPAG